eukprot:m.31267 g.31267  ORF g.31267 m.31267 type:complete len:1384 (+) comp4787_c0_seq1:244-4395(+)
MERGHGGSEPPSHDAHMTPKRKSATMGATADLTGGASWQGHTHAPGSGGRTSVSHSAATRRMSGRGEGDSGMPPVGAAARRGSHPHQHYMSVSSEPDRRPSGMYKDNKRQNGKGRYQCYSSECRKSKETDGWKGMQGPCYSLSCPYRESRPKRSYWRHPKVRALLIRAKICCIQNLPARIQPYSSFVPRMLHDYLQRLSTAEERGEGEYLPFGEVHKGAVLLADASGFTVLTERLSSKNNGAEILCGILNEFFDEMVRIIHDHGGDVIKFAGDAVMVLWESDRVDRRNKQTMQGAAQCATQCALAIHNRLHNFKAIEDKDGAVLLTLHIGVGCGQLTSVHVGGVFNRWEFVVGGPPMHAQCAIAEPAAESGETVVSTEVWELIKHVADGTRLSALAAQGRTIDPKAKDFVLIHRLRAAADVPIADELKIEPRASDLEYLQRYIPSAVHKQLEAGHDAYIAEIRPISIVFIKVDGVKIEAHKTGDESVPLDCTDAIVFGQELMLKIQEIIYEFEGSVNKMMIDDKGQVILCVFGLNPYFHHDDPVRAVRSALMVVKRLQNLREGVSVSVGVASGPSFCGIIGSNRKKASAAVYGQRREYTVMGRMVNLAARLMGNAGKNGILIDDETQKRTKGLPDLSYTGRQMHLKGLGRQTVWEPEEVGRAKNRMSVIREPLSKSAELAVNARRKELAQIEKALGEGSANGVVVVITGGRGAGKGAVYDAAMEAAKELDYHVLGSNVKKFDGKSKQRGGGDSALDAAQGGNGVKDYDKPTFGVWRPILSEMVAIGSQDEKLPPHEYLRHILSAKPGGASHLALLKLVLPDLDITTPPRPADANVARHSPVPDARCNLAALQEADYWSLTLEQRQILMVDMLTRCLGHFSQRHKTLIAMHLQTGTSYKQIMEPESWVLSQHVADHLCTDRPKGMPKLVFFMTNRPSVYYSPPEYDHIQQVAARTRTCIHLKPLDPDQRVAYLAEYLNVDADKVPRVFRDYISAMGAGNPKNTEEILDKMRDEDKIFKVEGDKVVLAPGFETPHDFFRVELPPKLVSTQMNILERMQEKHRLVVKIASVWDTFTLAMLSDILPYHRERDELVHILLNLVESSILSVGPIPEDLKEYHPDVPDESAYTFVSKVMQRQANSLLLQQHRQEIQPSIDLLEKRRAANRVHVEEIAQFARVLKSVRNKMVDWLGIDLEAPRETSTLNGKFTTSSGLALHRRHGFRAGRLTMDATANDMGHAAPTHLSGPATRSHSDADVNPGVVVPPMRHMSADALVPTGNPPSTPPCPTDHEGSEGGTPLSPSSVAILSARVRELELELGQTRGVVNTLHQQMAQKDELIAGLTSQLASPQSVMSASSAPSSEERYRTPPSGGKARSPWLRKKKKDKK